MTTTSQPAIRSKNNNEANTTNQHIADRSAIPKSNTNSNIACFTWKMRLGAPFRGLDNLFIYWLDNYFGTNRCFDKRFLINHAANIDVETKLYQPKFSFSLHPIIKNMNGNTAGFDINSDLRITAITGERYGIREWMIGYNKSAFDFDPLQAIRDNLLLAKLSAPQHQLKSLLSNTCAKRGRKF